MDGKSPWHVRCQGFECSSWVGQWLLRAGFAANLRCALWLSESDGRVFTRYAQYRRITDHGGRSKCATCAGKRASPQTQHESGRAANFVVIGLVGPPCPCCRFCERNQRTDSSPPFHVHGELKGGGDLPIADGVFQNEVYRRGRSH